MRSPEAEFSLALFLAEACVRKRKLTRWCGQDTGSYGRTSSIYRRILQFPEVALATVCPKSSGDQSHLTVIPGHSQGSGMALPYRIVGR